MNAQRREVEPRRYSRNARNAAEIHGFWAVAAVDEVVRTTAGLAAGDDRLARKAAHDRAVQAYNLELVKSARQRAGIHGDAALINFLRHGRP
jgi:predicted secreted Zn-dependent protease